MLEGENRLLMLTIKSYLLLQDDLLETEVAGENAAELRDDLDRDEAVSSNVGILDLPLLGVQGLQLWGSLAPPRDCRNLWSCPQRSPWEVC